MLKEDEEKSLITEVRTSLSRYENFLSTNTLAGDEKVSVTIRDDDRVSVVKYQGSEGEFTIRCDPKKGVATAVAKFITGDFKSKITSDNTKETRGQAPVYNPHWGVFEVFHGIK